MNPFQQWACTRIQKILALESADAAEEIVNYASQVSSKSELESYFKSLLGNTPQTLDFIQQFWERNEKEKSTPQTVATPKQQAATIPEGYKLYKKNEYSANENEDEDVDENESSQTKKFVLSARLIFIPRHSHSHSLSRLHIQSHIIPLFFITVFRQSQSYYFVTFDWMKTFSCYMKTKETKETSPENFKCDCLS